MNHFILNDKNAGIRSRSRSMILKIVDDMLFTRNNINTAFDQQLQINLLFVFLAMALINFRNDV